MRFEDIYLLLDDNHNSSKDSQTFDFMVCKEPWKDAAAEIFAVR
jgi:hypothetical protein